MKKKILSTLTAVAFIICLLAGCGTQSEKEEQNDSKGTVVIGIAGVSDSQIAGNLYGFALEEAGYTVERKDGLEMAHDALLADEIDIYVGYTGTLFSTYMEKEPLYDAEEVAKQVREFYADEYDVAVLEPSQINNTYSIIMMKDRADELNIKTIADLQKNSDKLVFGNDGSYIVPTIGKQRLEELYGPFNFVDVVDISSDLSFDILATGDIDAVTAYTTDSRLADDKYFMLDPEKNVWPDYLLVPLVRQQILDENPEIEEILNNVSSKLNNDVIIPLNQKCNVDHEEVYDVAKEFYEATFK